VFTCDRPFVSVIPVKNQLAVLAFANYVTIHRHSRPAGQINLDPAGLQRQPARARQAVLRGMNRISGSLAGEISNEQVHGGLGLLRVAITSQQKIARTEDIQCVLRDGHVPASPRPKVLWECCQALTRRNKLFSGSPMEE